MKFPRVVSMILVTFVFRILIVDCTEQRFIEMPPSYMEVFPGNDLLLRCSVLNRRGVCIWQKDRKPITISRGKYEFTMEDANDCSIIIRDADHTYDDGFWECQVTSSDYLDNDALSSLPTRLVVLDPWVSTLSPRAIPRWKDDDSEGSNSSTTMTTNANNFTVSTTMATIATSPLKEDGLKYSNSSESTKSNRDKASEEKSPHGFEYSDTFISMPWNPHYVPEPKENDRLNKSKVEETVRIGLDAEVFECPEFDGNPKPRYQWVHLQGGSFKDQTRLDSSGRRLPLINVTWSHEGDYRCLAFNIINGTKRETFSDVRFVLHVMGPPEIQTKPPRSAGNESIDESISYVGKSVHLFKSRFCSQPPPCLVAWRWGRFDIKAGESIPPKYKALPLEPITKDNMPTSCYWTKLEVKNLEKSDARTYSLLVQNPRGTDSMDFRLIITNPTEIGMITVFWFIVLFVTLLVTSIVIYTTLRMKQRQRKHITDAGRIAIL